MKKTYTKTGFATKRHAEAYAKKVSENPAIAFVASWFNMKTAQYEVMYRYK